MKKLTLIALLFFIGLTANSWATTFTGTILGGSTLFGTSPWNTNSTNLSWTVYDDPNTGLWTFEYIFTVPSKAISHVILEVSSNFTVANIFSGTTPGYSGPDTYVQDGSNPGMPAGGVLGLKWNTSNNPLVYSFTIVTNRMPMWGDFYAKDGTDQGNWVFAYNKNFGTNTTEPIANGNAGGWVLVPDTQTGVIPEPGTFLLLGTGLLGIAAIRYRRSKQ